ncbi:MAG: DUF4333 domain-containing protein [Actinomycetota bacterium]
MTAVRHRLTVLVLVGLVAAACTSDSVNPKQEAIGLIEGELADQAALGPLAAACPDAEDVEAGGSFECTGTTGDGQVVRFTAEVTDDGAGEIVSTNLLTPEDIPTLADDAATVLAEQNDLEPAPMTCDDSSGFVIEQGAVLDCELTDPATGDMLGATITITDPVNVGYTVELKP